MSARQITFTTWIALAGVISQAQAQSASRQQIPGNLSVGDYLRDDYLENLSKTRSPFKSVIFGQPQLLTILFEDRTLIIRPTFNFHYGGSDLVLNGNGTVVERDAKSSTANITFKILSPRQVLLGFDRLPSKNYTFVGDFGVYVNQVVLAGDYTDGKGRHYIFGRNGTATFPDHKFTYMVGTDHTFSQFDYFYSQSSNGEVFAFERNGNTLKIFRTSGELNEQHVEKVPIFLLQRVVVGK